MLAMSDLDPSDDPKPETSALFLRATEVCSALQPLPSESLIPGEVRALPSPAPALRKLARLPKI